MELIEFVKQNDCKNLILFIHGFTGDNETWKHQNASPFPELLLENMQISENFDIAYFSYFTKLCDLCTTGKNALDIIKGLVGLRASKYLTNNSVDEIANLLRTEIRFTLADYENIIVVAHSMGGLITKSCIVKDFNDSAQSKIKLFISLAVPHSGADAATLGRMISSNLQIRDLAPLSASIYDLNDSWLKMSQRPETKYFYGTHDPIVPKTSSVPVDKEIIDAISVNESHISISKPESANSTLVKAINSFMVDLHKIDNLQYFPLDDESSYNDELFVLKLMVADIHNSVINDAKEVFLNAEYIRKQFSSSADQKRLAELYENIRGIYKNNYVEFLHDGFDNSGLFLAQVHKEITEQNTTNLKTEIPFIDSMHKKGMLHQLANAKDRDVWWTSDTDLESLYKIIGS